MIIVGVGVGVGVISAAVVAGIEAVTSDVGMGVAVAPDVAVGLAVE